MKKVVSLIVGAIGAVALLSSCGSSEELKHATDIAQNIDKLPTAEELVYGKKDESSSLKVSGEKLNSSKINLLASSGPTDLLSYDKDSKYSISWGNIFGFKFVYDENVSSIKFVKDAIIENAEDLDTWTKCLGGNDSTNRAKVHLDSDTDIVTIYYLSEDYNMLEKIVTYTNERSNVVIEYSALANDGSDSIKYLNYVENEYATFYEAGELCLFDLSSDKFDFTYIYDLSTDKKSDGSINYRLYSVKEDDEGYYDTFFAEYSGEKTSSLSYNKFDSNYMLVSSTNNSDTLFYSKLKLSLVDGVQKADYYYNDIPYSESSIFEIIYNSSNYANVTSKDTSGRTDVALEPYIRNYDSEIKNPMTSDIYGIYGLLEVFTNKDDLDDIRTSISLSENNKNLIKNNINILHSGIKELGFDTLSKSKYDEIFNKEVLNNFQITHSLYETLNSEKY